MIRCFVLAILWVIVVIGATHFIFYGLGIIP